jgi:hypothetical protein
MAPNSDVPDAGDSNIPMRALPRRRSTRIASQGNSQVESESSQGDITVTTATTPQSNEKRSIILRIAPSAITRIENTPQYNKDEDITMGDYTDDTPSKKRSRRDGSFSGHLGSLAGPSGRVDSQIPASPLSKRATRCQSGCDSPPTVFGHSSNSQISSLEGESSRQVLEMSG